MDQLANTITQSTQLLYYLNEDDDDYVLNSSILGVSEKNFCGDPASYREVEIL